jgi:4,5-DOPA dioxygenase extradiol
MFAVEGGSTGPALQQWANGLRTAHPELRGIVVMSPHWISHGVAVMTNPAPKTWHDFGGFPQALYELQYPARGDAALGQEVIGMLQQAGMDARADVARPLDHGAWVPLRIMFAQADVAVVQVALPVGAGPREIYQMGLALQALRSQGVLVMGSGSMTHNLGEFFGGQREAAPYVIEFSRWVESAVMRGEKTTLLHYAELAPHALRAHPSDDHFLPIFFALGAAAWGGEPACAVDYLSREVMYGMLAMDAFALGTAPGFAAGPLPRRNAAPLGGSELHAVNERGG